MAIIALKDLIHIVPDLINLFLPGFICIALFSWLNNKKYDISIMTIWGLFISFIIKTFYLAIHSVLLIKTDINDALKVLIYICTGTILAFVTAKILHCKLIQKLLYNTNNKSINEDIFDDIIDYNMSTMMQIYLKSSDVYYIGKFVFREEKGLDSWIVLIDYCTVDKKTNGAIYNSNDSGLSSTVAVNLRDVERIELIYEKDSEVWERLSGKKDTTKKYTCPCADEINELIKEYKEKETDK